MNEFDCDVVVIGAGPTGLAASVSAALRGLSAVVVDAPSDRPGGSRAPAVHPGTLRVLEELGCAAPLIAESRHIDGIVLRSRRRMLTVQSTTGLPGQFTRSACLTQERTEAILRARADRVGVRFVSGRAVEVRQDDRRARVLLADGSTVAARYGVGADGIGSTTRAAVGIPFPDTGTVRGDDEPMLIADIVARGDVDRGHVTIVLGDGLLVMVPLPGEHMRIVMNAAPDPNLADEELLRREFRSRRAIPGRGRPSADISEVEWLSRFSVHHHLADSFRSGRMLLAGDAAHVHSPYGGQGMNLGIRDGFHAGEAVRRAIAAEDSGASRAAVDAPLDVYAANRRAAAARVIAATNAMMAMVNVPPAARPARNLLLRALSHTRMPARRARAMSGLPDIGPDFAPASPAAVAVG